MNFVLVFGGVRTGQSNSDEFKLLVLKSQMLVAAAPALIIINIHIITPPSPILSSTSSTPTTSKASCFSDTEGYENSCFL